MAFQKTGKAEQVGESMTFEQVQKQGADRNAGDDANREQQVNEPKQDEKRQRSFRN